MYIYIIGKLHVTLYIREIILVLYLHTGYIMFAFEIRVNPENILILCFILYNVNTDYIIIPQSEQAIAVINVCTVDICELIIMRPKNNNCDT